MALLKDYLTKKLIYENHPAMASEKCLNTIQTKQPCLICQEVCPHGVFNGDEPNWDLCDGCGVCVSRCPSRCLRPSAMFAENILELCSRVKGDVTFSCSEQDSSADLKPLCLAAVPWELIALFALEGTVTLNMSKCKECPRRGLLCHFEQTLSEARHFLGDDRFQAAVIRCEVWDTTIPSNDRSFSRRDAFSLFFSKSKATAASLLPEDKELSPDGMLFRRLLAHRLRHLEPSAQNLSLSTPAFLRSCTACSLCTKVCPTQALHRVKGDLQGDVQRWYMALIPWRCTGCKLCTESCLSTGLSQPEWSTRADILTPVLHPVDAVPCPRCGEPLASGQSKGLCPRCEAESAPPIVW